jgi:hypothetical protein
MVGWTCSLFLQILAQTSYWLILLYIVFEVELEHAHGLVKSTHVYFCCSYFFDRKDNNIAVHSAHTHSSQVY